MMSNTLQADYLHDRAKGSIRFRIGAARIKKCKYIVLGVDTCADTVVGDEMRRGISGGQKRRLTTDATVLISLLQPAPETFELLDDIILMAEGKVVYQGLRDHVVEFFADWIQKFKESPLCKKLDEDLSVLYDKSKSHKDALSFNVLLNYLLIFLFFSVQNLLFCYRLLSLTITMNVFLRTQMDIDVLHATYYMGALFFGLMILLIDGIPELSLTTARLPVLFKQKELCFYPAWAYAIPATILKIPLLVIESVTWTCLTYYVIRYSLEAERFFRQLILLFLVHLTSISMFRFLASVFQTLGAVMTVLNTNAAPRSSRAMISQEKLAKIQGSQDSNDGGMVLPFEPLSVAFQDVKCYVDIPGPGVLTTLMGVSGAGKSTLLDVLPRKNGYLLYRGGNKNWWEFVNQVLEIIELDEIKDALVGVPGVIGPSTKQRKQLTVAVELVANPSIIFMDEPTSGFDAQGASIVMRAVKNVVETGRTIVCTDHQPNIDIFEAFDELSSAYSEVELGVDFAQIDTDFALYEHRKALVRELSTPPPGSKDLHFPTRFAQSGLGAIYILCMETELVLLEKSFMNLFRLVHAVIASLLFGVLFWDHGNEIDTQQSLFNMFGAFYVSMIFMASITAQPLYPVLQRSAMLCDRCASLFMSSSNYVRDHHLTDDWILWVRRIRSFGCSTRLFIIMLYCNYLAMLLVALTLTHIVASILSSVFTPYSISFLDSSFLNRKFQNGGFGCIIRFLLLGC
ncbi:hypothetical protein Patl1_24289 [Pistacia atlantica]|uniref:Uncharacterized protein n=1 Tax=Pistacia atlantica TaxID=434234 RepID=A0ACC0ZZR1_9ROSI|nr:hypothetical protein Patl1_24289 [Pistacia atlantica]